MVVDYTYADGVLVRQQYLVGGVAGDTYDYTYDTEGQLLDEVYVDKLSGGGWSKFRTYVDCP